MLRKTAPLLILLAAFALRAWQITAIPPGLTHDEAGHGHDAAYVLKGVTPIYFTVGYGREPLFDYLNAGVIGGLGASPFTLCFAAVAWGMIALAGTYRVARLALDRRTAVIALALMAFSFWPLATSRQILRSGMLPAEMAIAASLYLQLFTAENAENAERRKWWLTIALGLALAASFYTYIPARVLWLMFPLAAFAQNASQYFKSALRNPRTPGANVNPPHASRVTRHVFLSVLIAFALASPLFIYLYQHPEAEQRIGMLSEPLVALRNGNLSPILANAREAFLAFFLPGHGDHFLAYTIPGKPIFDPITALLFVVGLFLLLTSTPPHTQAASLPHMHTERSRSAHTPLLLLWLLLGLAPSFITGPEAMTTRIIGAQPVLYILPALALSRVATAFNRQRSAIHVGVWILGFGILAAFTARDYFVVWGQSRDVRAAYQSTLIAALQTIRGPAVISSVYPSAAHDPYIAELITNVETRWTDGRSAMIIPAESGFQLIVPSSTPLHPAFVNFVQPIRTMTLRPDDLDPTFTVYELAFDVSESALPAQTNFSNAVTLMDYRWSSVAYRPGDAAELITTWRVLDPAQLGAVHPPAFKSDLNLFTHVLNADGTILLQRDSLDAPAWDWQNGDTIMQVHRLAVPADTKAGEYAAEVGLYDRVTGERLTVIDSGATSVTIAPLIIRK